MNLLNRKVFITDSAWICLLDENHELHSRIKTTFENILKQDYRLITSSYVIDSTLETLKNNFSKQKAHQFLDIMNRAVLGNYIKVYWLNRRLRQKAIESFLLEDFSSMTRASNIELIRQKNVHAVLTLHPKLYKDLNIPCINID